MSLDMLRLCSLDGPSTRAVILFHGLTGTRDECQALAQHLHDKGFDTFVPRLSGHESSIEELKTIPLEAWLENSEQALAEVLAADYREIFFVGLSFGALLALHLAQNHKADCKALVLMSPPLKLKNLGKELLLTALSYLPNFLLNRLGLVAKTKRAEGIFAKERNSYHFHSIAAVARVLQLVRKIEARLVDFETPTLLLQDPDDHHLSPEVPSLLQTKAPRAEIALKWIPEGQHELTLGHQYTKVFAAVEEFILAHSKA